MKGVFKIEYHDYYSYIKVRQSGGGMVDAIAW